MAMKNLLIDRAGIDGYFQGYSKLNESTTSDRGYPTTVGVLQRKNAQNKNGRRYPGPILEKCVNEYLPLIKERRALGELDHPDTSVVELKNVSHNIVEANWQGDDLIGTIEIICDRPDGRKGTPSGNILKALLDYGAKIGISSRGMGSVSEQIDEAGNPSLIVQDDFELVCWDFVSNPSTHGAWQPLQKEGVLAEGVQLTENKYSKIESILGNIICDNNGFCPCILSGKDEK